MRKRESPSPYPRLGRWLIGALFVLAALVVLMLLQRTTVQPAGMTGQVVNAVSPLPTAAPPSQPIAPTPPTVAACTFKADVSASPLPKGELHISLSTPQVVLTDTHRLRIGPWSPDGTSILLAREERGRLSESIDAYVVQSRKLEPYGSRISTPSAPFWDAEGKAALFEDGILNSNRITDYLIRTEKGDSKLQLAPTRTVIAGDLMLNLKSTNLNPTTGAIILFTGSDPAQPVTTDTLSGRAKVEAPLPRLPTQWPDDSSMGVSAQSVSNPPESISLGWEGRYQAAWNPAGNVVAFHNIQGLFLYNVREGLLCKVDLGTYSEGQNVWAWDARWSPTGRYLGMVTTTGMLPFRHTWLTILDTFDGSLRKVERATNVTAVRWRPTDDRGLIFAEQVPDSDVGLDTLWLMDSGTMQSQPLAEAETFGSLDTFGSGFEFSPDGTLLAVACPLGNQDPNMDPGYDTLCLIEIKVQP